MTISTWLLILTFAVGSGQFSGSSSTMEPSGVRPPLRPSSNCWINGVWYNPCPSTEHEPPPLPPLPLPEVQQPN